MQATQRISYAELHSHSCFSLLDGASTPEDLMVRAVELGMDVLALTDHNSVYGAVQFVTAARKHGIKPILGAELTLHDHSHLTLLVQNQTGWSNLCALITTAQHHAPKGEALLPQGFFEKHSDGLIALSGCRQGAVPQALRRGDHASALSLAQHYRDLFGHDRFWIELQHHLLPDDNALVSKLASLAGEIGVGVVATNNVHYAKRERHALQDVLVCIRHNTTLDEASHLRPNSEYYLKSGAELAPMFARCPEALTNTRRIADLCDFEL